MGRRYQLLLAVLVAGVVMAGVANAGIPDPNLSDVPNVLYVPGGGLPYIVTVNGSEGPIDTADVQLVFSTEADGLIAWCTGQPHVGGIITAQTDASGFATFDIAAGGCIDPARTVGTPVVEVFANGIKLAEVGCVSPDAVDNNGVLPTAGWVVGGMAVVGLADASFHTPPIKSGTYEFCTDFNSDMVIGLDDASILTPWVKAGSSCTSP